MLQLHSLFFLSSQSFDKMLLQLGMKNLVTRKKEKREFYFREMAKLFLKKTGYPAENLFTSSFLSLQKLAAISRGRLKRVLLRCLAHRNIKSIKSRSKKWGN
jgi:predicted transcriptional regulator